MFQTNTLLTRKFLSVALLVTLTTTACNRKKEPTVTVAVTPPSAVPVKLQTLQSTETVDFEEYFGQLQAKQKVSLKPVSSGRIERILVPQGQTVKTGTPIMQLRLEQNQAQVEAAKTQVEVQRAILVNTQVRVSSAEAEVARQEANIKAAQADVESRKSDVQLAQTNYQRIKLLADQGALPRQELNDKDSTFNNAKTALEAANQNVEAAKKSLGNAQTELKAAQAQVVQAQAAVAQAQAKVKAAGESLVYNRVAAPIDGMVGSIPVKVGDYVNVGQELTTITQNDAFDLDIRVSAKRSSEVKLGQPVQLIDPKNNQPAVTGSINFISAKVDAATQAIETKARFPNVNNILRDGLTVRARIIWNKTQGILVPSTAITRIGSQPFVFVAEETPSGGQMQQVVRQKPIQLGTLQGDYYQVKDGLKPGESIAVSNILRLKDGMPIQPES